MHFPSSKLLCWIKPDNATLCCNGQPTLLARGQGMYTGWIPRKSGGIIQYIHRLSCVFTVVFEWCRTMHYKQCEKNLQFGILKHLPIVKNKQLDHLRASRWKVVGMRKSERQAVSSGILRRVMWEIFKKECGCTAVYWSGLTMQMR